MLVLSEQLKPIRPVEPVVKQWRGGEPYFAYESNGHWWVTCWGQKESYGPFVKEEAVEVADTKATQSAE